MGKYDPGATRQRLLDAAFEELYQAGLSGSSLDAILARAGVTKGALYHHFANKKKLCEAVVQEVILPAISRKWLHPLREVSDPVPVLRGILAGERERPEPETVRFGCPLNNLSQEALVANEDLRLELARVVQAWVDGLRNALARGQGAGRVRPEVDPAKVARFVVSSIEGAMGMAKVSRSPEALQECYEVLDVYLESLVPEDAG